VRAGITFAGLLAAEVVAAATALPLESVQYQGLQVDFFAAEVQRPDRNQIQAGEEFRIAFGIQDRGGNPVNGAYPAAWIHPRAADEKPTAELCTRKVQSFLGGSLFAKPALDLNTYQVVTLNDSPTLSVVDPLFGFGGSQLLAMVPLPAPGYDWVKSNEQDSVYISIPDTDQIARLDTADWSTDLIGNETSTPRWHVPARLALQPDGHYLWLAVAEGVAVFERDPWRWIKTLALDSGIEAGSPTRPGSQVDPTEFAFSPDSRFVFLSRYQQDELSILDSRDLSVLHRLRSGDGPVSVAYSSLSQSLYIAHQNDGRIAVLPIAELLSDHAPKLDYIQSEAGIEQLRISPDGRCGFVINAKTGRLSLLDVADQRLIQQSPTESSPDQIAFSDDLAYIRHAKSETLYLITLDNPDFGHPGRPVAVIDTPGGDRAFAGHAAFTPASGIVKAPGASAVLIANPGDRAVYFYKEGMAAPMGQFTNYGHAPRAVLAIDRSLRESRRPGLYESSARLDQPGIYDVVFFLDNPRILHCFPLPIEAAPETVTSAVAWTIEAEKVPARLTVGVKHILNLRLHSPAGTRDPEASAANLPIESLITLSSGLWRQRLTTRSDARGAFRLEITPPIEGFYQIRVQAPVQGLSLDGDPLLTLFADVESVNSNK
jgi:DNA-binding beta-propeller fold protein YncE